MLGIGLGLLLGPYYYRLGLLLGPRPGLVLKLGLGLGLVSHSLPAHWSHLES